MISLDLPFELSFDWINTGYDITCQCLGKYVQDTPHLQRGDGRGILMTGRALLLAGPLERRGLNPF